MFLQQRLADQKDLNAAKEIQEMLNNNAVSEHSKNINFQLGQALVKKFEEAKKTEEEESSDSEGIPESRLSSQQLESKINLLEERVSNMMQS